MSALTLVQKVTRTWFCDRHRTSRQRPDVRQERLRNQRPLGCDPLACSGGACRRSQSLPARVTSGAGLSSVCLAVAATHTYLLEQRRPHCLSWGSGGPVRGVGEDTLPPELGAGAPGAGPLGDKPLLESGGCALCAGCVLGSSCQGGLFHPGPGPSSSLGMEAPDG